MLESLCAEVQCTEQEKCKTRQERKFDALLSNVQQWRGQRARDEASNRAKWVVIMQVPVYGQPSDGHKDI